MRGFRVLDLGCSDLTTLMTILTTAKSYWSSNCEEITDQDFAQIKFYLGVDHY